VSDDAIVDIIRLCLDIDTKAEALYRDMAARFGRNEIGSFFDEMCGAERQHIAFWNDLLHMAEEGMIPQVFDHPHKVIAELQAVGSRIESLIDQYHGLFPTNEAFLISFRLEFYLLHPALETLFHYGKTIEGATGLQSPLEEYESHIDKFISALNRLGNVSPEMELVGESLKTLWQENRSLTRLTNVDQLTGVLNRRGFLHAVQPLSHLAQRNAFDIGVLMIDIDHFKKINDTYGHQAGDEVLVRVAASIKSSLRISDLVGRYGGEEFIVFMPEVRVQAMRQVAEKARRSVEAVRPRDIPVTVSIGGASSRIGQRVNQDVENLIKQADDRLYQAKREGRNRVLT